MWNKILDVTLNSFQQAFDGSLILTGIRYRFLSDGPYPYVSLTKTDKKGREIWNITLGRGSGNSVGPTYDGGYIVAGETASDALLFKSDSDGNIMWYRTFGKKLKKI